MANRADKRRDEHSAGGEVGYHLMVERMTDNHAGGERVVISCNVQAGASVDEMGSSLKRMGDACLRRVADLNDQWQRIEADGIAENMKRQAEEAAAKNGGKPPTEPPSEA